LGDRGFFVSGHRRNKPFFAPSSVTVSRYLSFKVAPVPVPRPVRTFGRFGNDEACGAGADIPTKRTLLELLCLNFSATDANLCVTMNKPFDIIAEGLTVQFGRGDWI
jgi:hypothetical protein